jgi:hypothetical protein
VLILGLGWSGACWPRTCRRRAYVAGTVRDPSSAPDDGLLRHPLRSDTLTARPAR